MNFNQYGIHLVSYLFGLFLLIVIVINFSYEKTLSLDLKETITITDKYKQVGSNGQVNYVLIDAVKREVHTVNQLTYNSHKVNDTVTLNFGGFTTFEEVRRHYFWLYLVILFGIYNATLGCIVFLKYLFSAIIEKK